LGNDFALESLDQLVTEREGVEPNEVFVLIVPICPKPQVPGVILCRDPDADIIVTWRRCQQSSRSLDKLEQAVEIGLATLEIKPVVVVPVLIS
jgi:hypothetical protein